MHADADLALTLYGPGFNEIIASNGGANTESVTANVTETGQHYVRVSGPASAGDYEMTVTVTP